MPKVRRKNVPRALIEHLALRVRERAVPIEDLQNLAKWLDTDPTVPSGRWFKRFATCVDGSEIERTSSRRQSDPDQSAHVEHEAVRQNAAFSETARKWSASESR
jgi:hypothetical protein